MSKKILLVDDDPLILEDLAGALEESGYRVWATESTDRAVELTAELAPDVVVTDYRMPGMDGLSLLERVSGLAPIPVMVVYSGTEPHCGGGTSGQGVHWVAKSAGHGALIDKLRDLLKDDVDRR